MMKTHFPRTSRGFTLIELMTTLTIAVVLMLIAIPNFVDFRRTSALISAANELVASMQAGRGEAMKRNLRAIVAPTDGSSWANGWRVYVDTNNDQTYTAGTDILIQQTGALPTYLSVTANSTATGTAPYIMFNGSGFPCASTGINCSFSAVTMSINRNDNSALVDSPSGTRRVILAPTGRIRVCRPSSSTDTSCLASGNTN
ncbi:MAG: GspH/FimT family pseudopilin [Brachymonas sp.]